MRLLPCTCRSSYRKGLHCCNCNMRHCMPCLCCATLAHYITLCLRSNWSCSHSSEHVQLHDDISRVQLQWWCHLTAVEDASTSVIRCRTAFQSAEQSEETGCRCLELSVGRARLSEHLIITWYIYIQKLECRLLFGIGTTPYRNLTAHGDRYAGCTF